MKLKNFLFAMCTTLVMSSCATIFTGSKTNVSFTSVPSGATIMVDGIDRGTTPAVVKLKRGSGQVITLRKDGYRDRTFEPEQTFQAISIFNLTNLLGWGVDAISGSIKKYDPKFYEIKLEESKN